MSARNSHLEIENESLKSEIKNVRADYGALQTDMNDVRDYYHQVDIAASKMGHRCEVCMRPVFYSDHSQKWGYATGRHEEGDGKTLVCDKRDRAISCVFCCYLHLTPMFSDPLQKDLSKGKWSLAKSCFKQNYCHACHTRFAVFLFLPSCCLSSILTLILSVPVQAPPSYVIFGFHGITPVIHCWISFLSIDVKPT